MENRAKESKEIEETILIVGYHDKSRRFFSSSRCGEAFLNEYVWIGLNGRNAVEKAGTYRARIQLIDGNVGDMHRVLKVYERVAPWDGVIINRSCGIQLNAVVVEKRRSCFALDTEPFGLVTYPLDSFLPTDVKVGNNLRVNLARHKDACRDDYPSKWLVSKVVDVLNEDKLEEGRGTRKENDEQEERKKEAADEERLNNEWFEGVVTCITNPTNVLITFKHGSALYQRNSSSQKKNHLSLGDIVRIRVVSYRTDWFLVVDMDDHKSTRKDIVVEHFMGNKSHVFCVAEVIERRDTYFLLVTPIIGLVLFFFKEAPRGMEVGDVWRVKILRRKDRQDYPSFWVATGVHGECPRVLTGHTTKEDESECTNSSDIIIPVTTTTSQYSDWSTMLCTGSDDCFWYCSCAELDPIRIGKNNLYLSGKNLERGSFYRVLLSRGRDGILQPIDVNPHQIYPRDIQKKLEGNKFLIWCYSKIVDVQESSFTVHNEVLGNATLPFKRSTRNMRVGDELETLYYRVKTTNNPTHWMVQEAHIVPSKSNYYEDDEIGDKQGRNYEEHASEDMNEYRENIEFNETRIGKKLVVKECRIIEITRYFMMIPELRKIFEREDPKSLEQINLILDKHVNTQRIAKL